MRTEKEVQEQIQRDLEFIISAVTSELHDMAYLNYFDTWENNGGMGWFFDECVEITHKIMLTEGSPYLKWLDHWKGTEGNGWDSFSEVTGETCFDWYHMNEARKLFKSRYEEDECSKGQISEFIGVLIDEFKTDEDRNDVMDKAIKFANKRREEREKREKELEFKTKKLLYDKIINDLKELDVDGEMMQYVIEGVGMDDQMHRQLILSKDKDATINLLEELNELKRGI